MLDLYTLMEPLILIGIFTVIFLITGYYIWRRDSLYGLIYLFLFVYIIFAQIGYVYFPALSELMMAYFGQSVFYDVNIFVTLSFVSFFFAFYFLYSYVVRCPAYKVVSSLPRLNIIFYIAVIGHIIFITLYLYSNYDLISYVNAYDPVFQSSQGLLFIIFGIAFKQSVAVNIILYFMLRVKTRNAPHINRTIVLILSLLELTLFVIVSLKLGNRTDPISMMLGITFIEVGVIRGAQNKLINIFTLILVMGVLLYGLIMIESGRSQEETQAGSFAEKILSQDYYAPSHILIAAMGLQFVDPVEVIASNSANAFILLKYPYLQEIVTEKFNPGIATRSTGYAFYLFSEGYLALGRFGFIYNGLVVFLGVSLWRRLSHSNNNYYNLFMLSLVATQAVNIVRGQSSYFIKNIYIIFFPAMFLFFLGTGLLPWIGSRIKKNSPAVILQPSSIK